MGWESSGVVGFDLGPLLQGQTSIAKLKSAYNSLIIGPRGLGWLPTYRKSKAELLVWSDLTFGLSFMVILQGQTSIAKHKSAYNSVVIGPGGFRW